MLLHLPAKTLFAAIGHLASTVWGYCAFLMTPSSDFMSRRLGTVAGWVLLGLWGRLGDHGIAAGDQDGQRGRGGCGRVNRC